MNEDLQYWDACIFISWIKNNEQNREKSELSGLKVLFHLLQNGKINVLTSTITLVEVCQAKFSKDQAEAIKLENDFLELMTMPYFRLCPVDEEIGNLARILRNYYKFNKTYDGVLGFLTAIDAIHLATAIHYRAKVFQTFDKKDKPNNNKEINLGLARLNGDPGVKGLKIEAPSAQDYAIPKKPGKLNLPNP